MKNKRGIIVGTLLLIILLMTVAYSAFATQLNVNGVAEITGEWDVKITNIEAIEISNGCDAGSPQHDDTTVSFNSKLEKPGDIILYQITVKNAGTIDAVLDTVVFKTEEGSDAIDYETTELKKELNAGEETTFNVKVKYDADSTEVPEIKTKAITS